MKKSYYAIVPANVRYNKKLTNGAKLLYGEITALCNQEGYCWATNSYFAGLYEVSNTTISTWIGQLERNGHIHRVIKYKKGSKEIEGRYLSILNEGIQENLHTPIQENLKGNTTSTNTTINNKEHAALFDEWWNFYDKKVDKKKCSNKYKRLLKEYSHEDIMNGTQKYFDHMKQLKKNGEFVPHKKNPLTFLNGENFNDEYDNLKIDNEKNEDINKPIEVEPEIQKVWSDVIE